MKECEKFQYPLDNQEFFQYLYITFIVLQP